MIPGNYHQIKRNKNSEAVSKIYMLKWHAHKLKKSA
jgi:hypothetical protein